MSTALAIEQLALPASADGPDAADLIALTELNNAICREDADLADLDFTPAEMLSGLRDDADRAHRAYVIREGGRLVGACILNYGLAEPTAVDFDLMVLAADRGHGVEDALLARIEEETRSLGRTVMQAWTLHRGRTSGPTIVPATDWGVVERTPLSDQFLTNGFVLEQVERNSTFDLRGPVDTVQHRLDESLAAAGPDYRLVEWTIPTPPELREGYAWALSRMSTDAPSAALEIDEEKWDAGRVERREKRILDGGQTMSVSAVLHVPTGRLAAFNELVIGTEPDDVTHQYSTLVLREHRGHRLGMLVKCANILRWRGIAPRSPKISTFNAEENRPMLDINEAIGFAPVSYAGVWQKKLV
ncbi:GNAT family N-acetyltransferase [Microbacterium sp. KUDC0406]|uniref:GNAT family N-acetyltransferase n=1 Tax=Microbacterium sp. KUDC0406 TaxID=2909588 RepID=UPI001F35066B|nr:GNAT family N-acetyltransferase [Microbacterium sp. KUDC0406]UJP11203.1 GNAT family N-acetyltransferase [Microbacterium sp. KUDC0406]